MRVTANQVTTVRLAAMPLLGYLVYCGPRAQVFGVVLGTLIGLTDFVDGYLARKHGVTVLGSLLDPVADKVFIVVCYACYADRGGMPWGAAAAILAREMAVTVLRSSLELRGQRLPSSLVAKVKTWVQMIGFGFVVLVPLVGPGRGLALLFAVPLGATLLAMAIAAVLARRRIRALEFAAAVLVGFLVAAVAGGPAVTRGVVIGFVVLITWYSALDYFNLGLRALARPDAYRVKHWARLAAGGLLPVVALAAIATDRLPTLPIILLLSIEMARGALDNFAANRRVVDFSWAASLTAEVVLLVVAMLLPPLATTLAVAAALIGVTETLRSLTRYLRAPAPSSAAVPVAPVLVPPVDRHGDALDRGV
jgi:CDP-diacylglycerol--glycerol-3-phosphate 3-phosphatidyltransferase